MRLPLVLTGLGVPAVIRSSQTFLHSLR